MNFLSYPYQCQGCVEISLVSFWFNVSHGASLGDFLLTFVCLKKKLTLWEGLLCLSWDLKPPRVRNTKFSLNWGSNQGPLEPRHSLLLTKAKTQRNTQHMIWSLISKSQLKKLIPASRLNGGIILTRLPDCIASVTLGLLFWQWESYWYNYPIGAWHFWIYKVIFFID